MTIKRQRGEKPLYCYNCSSVEFEMLTPLKKSNFVCLKCGAINVLENNNFNTFGGLWGDKND